MICLGRFLVKCHTNGIIKNTWSMATATESSSFYDNQSWKYKRHAGKILSSSSSEKKNEKRNPIEDKMNKEKQTKSNRCYSFAFALVYTSAFSFFDRQSSRKRRNQMSRTRERIRETILLFSFSVSNKIIKQSTRASPFFRTNFPSTEGTEYLLWLVKNS